jgi:hypothetical protein
VATKITTVLVNIGEVMQTHLELKVGRDQVGMDQGERFENSGKGGTQCSEN